MTQELIEQVEEACPINQIAERELNLTILKMGSFLSIVNNKKVNQAKLLIKLLEDENYCECFFKLSDIDNLQELVECLIKKYPTLCKSKVIHKSLKRKKKSGRVN